MAEQGNWQKFVRIKLDEIMLVDLKQSNLKHDGRDPLFADRTRARIRSQFTTNSKSDYIEQIPIAINKDLQAYLIWWLGARSCL